MVRQSVCKQALLSKMDNDKDFYVRILVDDLLYCKSSVCRGSMTIYYLIILPDSGVAQQLQLVEEYCTLCMWNY